MCSTKLNLNTALINSFIPPIILCFLSHEIQERSLGKEDPLKEEMATHPSIHSWKIPWTEETGGLQSMGSQRVRHNLVSEQTHERTIDNIVLSESKKSEFVDAKIKDKCH